MFTISKSLSVLHKHVSVFPQTLFVLGSGWNKTLSEVVVEKEIGYKELFGNASTVPGHEGKLIIGLLNNKRVAFMSGRFHMYEGYSSQEVTNPIRIFAKTGLKNLILTAACGALNSKYRVGDIIILNDIITLFLSLNSPLVGPQFIDTSCIFDKELRKKAVCVAKKFDISYHEGSHIFYRGPNYETPADKHALKILGADVCGMSITPETLVARSLGIKVLGLAFVTNLAFVKHDHKEVLREAERGSKKMGTLLKAILL